MARVPSASLRSGDVAGAPGAVRGGRGKWSGGPETRRGASGKAKAGGAYGGTSRRRRPKVWAEVLSLLGVLVFASVPMWWLADTPAMSDAARRGTAEAVALHERWIAEDGSGAGWGMADLIPRDRVGGVARDGGAGTPGVRWVHAAVLTAVGWQRSRLDAGDAGDGQREHAALQTSDAVSVLRGVSAVSGMVCVAGVFWAVLSVGGLLPASLAGLAAGSMPMVIWSGRSGDGAALMTAVGMVSVAGGLWGLRPLRPAAGAWRQVVGWVLAGAGWAASVWCGGLVVGVWVAVSLLGLVMLSPRRVGNLIALTGSACIGALCLLPWAVAVAESGAWPWWGWLEVSPVLGWLRMEEVVLSGWVGAAWLGGLGLWLLWLPAAVLQPTSTSSLVVGGRRYLILGVGWWLSAAAVVLAWPGSRSMVLLSLVSGVLVGLVLSHFHDLSEQGRHVRLWRWGRWPVVVGTTVLSMALPAAARSQGEWIDAGWLARPVLAELHGAYWAACGGVLLTLAVVASRFAYRHHVARATATWALWSLAMVLSFMWPLAHAPQPVTPNVLAVGSEAGGSQTHRQVTAWAGEGL